jgi:hypothetical protein
MTRAEPTAILGLRRCTARGTRRTQNTAVGASLATASTVIRHEVAVPGGCGGPADEVFAVPDLRLGAPLQAAQKMATAAYTPDKRLTPKGAK